MPHHNVVRLVDVRKISDRAAEARKRMDAAGEDDAAYEAALDDLVNAKATTIVGAKAQADHLSVILEAGASGDKISWELASSLLDSIRELLAKTAARSVA